MKTIQILTLALITLTIIKLLYMLSARKSFESFTKKYFESIDKNSYLYFSIYFSLSILLLYFIRTESSLTYTEITATGLFFAFLINAAMISYVSIFKNWDMKKSHPNKMSNFLFV